MAQRAFLRLHRHSHDKKDRSTPEHIRQLHRHLHIEQAVRTRHGCPSSTRARLPAAAHVGNHPGRPVDACFAGPAARKKREAINEEVRQRGDHSRERPKRVEAICLTWFRHFNPVPSGQRLQAQVVTCSREIAALYKETLDSPERRPQSAICDFRVEQAIRSLVKHHTSEEQRKDIIERFLKPAIRCRSCGGATCC